MDYLLQQNGFVNDNKGTTLKESHHHILQGATRTPKVSVVVPTLNEEKNLPYVLPKIPSWVHEIILVDGRSTDRTIRVARELVPDIHIVMEKKKGKGAALQAGFEAATGDIIVMIDADGSMAPEEMHVFVGALMSGADFVKGSRFLQGGGTADMEFYRRLGNWCFMTMVRLAFGGHYSDLCYGYNAFWRHVLPDLELNADGFEIETLINIRALKAHLNIAEVPSFEAERIHGTSNLRTLPDGWRVLKTIVRERLRPSTRRRIRTVLNPDFWSGVSLSSPFMNNHPTGM